MCHLAHLFLYNHSDYARKLFSVCFQTGSHVTLPGLRPVIKSCVPLQAAPGQEIQAPFENTREIIYASLLQLQSVQMLKEGLMGETQEMPRWLRRLSESVHLCREVPDSETLDSCWRLMNFKGLYSLVFVFEATDVSLVLFYGVQHYFTRLAGIALPS